jgi:phage shock protein A
VRGRTIVTTTSPEAPAVTLDSLQALAAELAAKAAQLVDGLATHRAVVVEFADDLDVIKEMVRR